MPVGERVALALSQYRETRARRGVTITSVAHDYGISRATLSATLNAQGERGDDGVERLLSDEQEQRVLAAIGDATLSRFPFRRDDVMDAASRIAGKQVGRRWFYNFLRRYRSQLTVRRWKWIELSRVRAEADDDSVLNWFAFKADPALRDWAVRTGSDPACIANCDETALSTLHPNTKLIGLQGQDVRVAGTTPLPHISLLLCVTASGAFGPLLFVVKGSARSQQREIERAIAPILPNFAGVEVRFNAKGSVQKGEFGSWCKSVAAWRKVEKKPFLLFADNASNRDHASGLRALRQADVRLMGFPSNTSHFLQPLDLSVFSTLKARLHRHLFAAPRIAPPRASEVIYATLVVLLGLEPACCRRGFCEAALVGETEISLQAVRAKLVANVQAHQAAMCANPSAALADASARTPDRGAHPPSLVALRTPQPYPLDGAFAVVVWLVPVLFCAQCLWTGFNVQFDRAAPRPARSQSVLGVDYTSDAHLAQLDGHRQSPDMANDASKIRRFVAELGGVQHFVDVCTNAGWMRPPSMDRAEG
jgi:hypothetical protein